LLEAPNNNMATTYGTLQRLNPRLRVIKGYVGQNSNQRQEVCPVASGMAIMSGMVISKLWSTDNARYEWVLGLVAGAEPYIALQDYTDTDVLAADGLTGLSCAGQYTLESAYFVTGTAANWSDNAKVSAYANNDGTSSNRGLLKLAVTGDPVIGSVIRLHAGLADARPYTSNVVPAGNGTVEVARFDTGYVNGNVA
jgi:hypothetical protein